jgi:hypothetical protein
MQSEFDTSPRFIAFSPSMLSEIPGLLEAYGAELPITPLDPQSPFTKCLAGGRDQSDDPLILRALALGQTAIPQTLTDGRLCFLGYWTLAALSAVTSGEVDAEEITEAEYRALQPQPEE